VGEEQLLTGQLDPVSDADVADIPAGTGGADGLHHRLLRADRLDDRVRAEPAGEVLDACHPLIAAVGDDVGRAELPGECLPGLVPAHRDDPLGPELPRGQHAEQPDRSVADDRDGLARPDVGGDGAEPAGAQHVGGREQAGDQVVRGHARGRDERAVGQRDTHPLRLCAADELPVHAGGLVAGAADLARVVAGEEAADDELPRLHGADVAADLLDDADILVTHADGPVVGLDAAVGPQVRAADAGGRQPDHGVRGLLDHGVLALLDSDVAARVQNGSSHGGSLRWSVSDVATELGPAGFVSCCGRPAWRPPSRTSPSATLRRTRGDRPRTPGPGRKEVPVGRPATALDRCDGCAVVVVRLVQSLVSR
jgi:hypothetical protein